MIRLDYYIRRKTGVSPQNFKNWWTGLHADLWRNHAETLGIRRHVQLVGDPENPIGIGYRKAYDATGEPFDGLATTCWADIRILQAALETPAGQVAYQEILADELGHIDTSRCRLSFGVNHAVIFPREKIEATKETDYTRVAYFPDALPDLVIPEVHRHWIAVHGGLTQDYAPNSPNAKYIQVHCCENELASRMRTDRNMAKNDRHFGHAEVWTSPADQERAANNPRRQELFPLYIEDIENFADSRTGYLLAGKDHYVVNNEIYTSPLPKPRLGYLGAE
ncbi:MAG: EthD domain-containing protein [Gammaproteobacteria bacterium]|nr:EthD domain-containing protein [Gammaproteobacteria bacterium]